jgi:hypothetical protein
MKYECIYLHAFETGLELRAGLARWVNYCNSDRPDSGLGGRTLEEAYHVIGPTPFPCRPGNGEQQTGYTNDTRDRLPSRQVVRSEGPPLLEPGPYHGALGGNAVRCLHRTGTVNCG